MKKVIHYVLYSEQQAHLLKDKPYFTPVLTINATQIEAIDTALIFNTQKAFEKLNRLITNREIAHTLSHIKCWKAIAENSELDDEDFALIAECSVNLVGNFQQLAQDYANRYPSYGIIKLQSNAGGRLFQDGDNVDAFIYGDISQYNKGCALYLIRKDLAKKLTTQIAETKPHWLAEQFTEFHEPSNIAQAYYLLGEIPKEKLQDKVESPLFSIIVPIYNVERYLEQCIESVIAQDYQNYELILVDDGSPDNSIDICIKYAKKYKNIIVIHKTNGGLSDARNAGIQIARGEYLMFLDSDDYWEGKTALTEIKNIITNSSPDLIIYDMAYLYNKEIEYYISSKDDLTGNYLKDFIFLTQRNIYRPTACNKIIKRAILIENHLLFKFGISHEDLEWSFKLAQCINTYSIYNKAFYIYRTKRKGSITEFVNVKNTEDLLDIAIEKIQQILTLENPMLQKGLSEYILRQKNYISDSVELLSPQDKNMLEDKYETFKKIIRNI